MPTSLFGLPKGSDGAILFKGDGNAPAPPVTSDMTYDVNRGTGGTVSLRGDATLRTSLDLASLGGVPTATRRFAVRALIRENTP